MGRQPQGRGTRELGADREMRFRNGIGLSGGWQVESPDRCRPFEPTSGPDPTLVGRSRARRRPGGGRRVRVERGIAVDLGRHRRLDHRQVGDHRGGGQPSRIPRSDPRRQIGEDPLPLLARRDGQADLHGRLRRGVAPADRPGGNDACVGIGPQRVGPRNGHRHGRGAAGDVQGYAALPVLRRRQAGRCQRTGTGWNLVRRPGRGITVGGPVHDDLVVGPGPDHHRGAGYPAHGQGLDSGHRPSGHPAGHRPSGHRPSGHRPSGHRPSGHVAAYDSGRWIRILN